MGSRSGDMDNGRLLQSVVIAVLLGVLAVGVIRSCWQRSSISHSTERRKTSMEGPGFRKQASPGAEAIRRELAALHSPEYLHRYIVEVIEKGSHQFDFPGGAMEGGYLSADLAPRVACYVMELGGHRCPHPYPKDAAMYFSSVCAGCHGSDGKGLHGSYPDLTRPLLLGIRKREEELRSKLSAPER